MATSPILAECQALLNDLDRVERRLSRLADSMLDEAADQDVDGISEIEGLIDSHTDVGGEFSALRARIVALGREHRLCPQEVPDEGYSPSRLRDLLESLQRMERGFKQPAPEPLESVWEQVPPDMLASLEESARQAAEESAQNPSSGERLPSDVEIFLDRVISDARHAALEEAKLPSGRLPSGVTASILRTPVPQRQISTQQNQKPVPEPVKPPVEPIPAASAEDQKASPKAEATNAGSEENSAPVEATAAPSTLASLPSDVMKVADAAEEEARREGDPAAASADTSNDWKPASVASERDYRDLLEYGEVKLGLGRSEFADLLANLALLNHKLDRFADAEELHRKELMIRENELGKEDPKVATSLNNLALLCKDMGRNQEAQELWERSLAIVEKDFGPEHPKVALRLGNLADLLQACGETAQAEQYYKRLLALRDTGTGRRRREAKSSLRKYANLLRTTRRKREARKVEAEIKTSASGWWR